MKENAVRKRLLQERKLTLKDCIDICKSNESTAIRLQAMNQEDVAYVRTKTYQKSKLGTRDRAVASPNKKSVTFKQKQHLKKPDQFCKFCGNSHVRSKSLCPAWGRTCTKCKKQNHFAKMCKTPMQGSSKQDLNSVEEYDSDSCDSLLTVDTEEMNVVDKDQYPNKIFAKMLLNGVEEKFQLDCGATVNVLPEQDYIRCFKDPELKNLEKSTTALIMYDRSLVLSTGKITVEVTNPRNSQSYNVTFQVIKEGCRPVLGARIIQHMDLIRINKQNISAVSESGNKLSEDILEKYKDVFKGEDTLPGSLKLTVDKDVPPVQLPPRKPPVALREKYKEELERLTKLKVIEPISEPTDWVSSTFFSCQRKW